MNLTLHLIGKDFRYLRLFLSVWLGLVILQAVLIGSYPHDFLGGWKGLVSLKALLILVAILKFCLLIVIVSQLVQKDSTIGSTAFWLSRPISGKRLLASKSLFLLLAVVLPVLVVEVLLLFVRGVTLDDTLRSIPQIIFLQILPIAVAMMLAALTTNLPRLILLGIMAFLVLPLLWFILGSLPSLTMKAMAYSNVGFSVVHSIPPPNYSLLLISIPLVFLGTAGIVIGHQYLSRRTMLSRTLLFLGVLLNLLTIEYWNSDWRTTAPQLDSGVLDPTQVATRIEEKSLIFAPVTAYLPVFYPTGEKKMLLRGDIALDNLPPGVVVFPAQISANLVLPSGESLDRHISHSSYAFESMSPLDRRLAKKKAALLLRQTLGDVVFLDAEHLSGQSPLDLFAISEDLYERYKGVRTVYSAQVDYLVQRAEVTTMRMEKGSRYDRGSDHVEIFSVGRSSGGGFAVLLSESTHRLIGDGRKDTGYLLVNSSRREALLGWSGYGSSDSISSPLLLSAIFPMLTVGRWGIHFDPPSDGPPIDAAWFQGAELVRLEARDLGWFSKSIRVEDFVMERIARSTPAPSQPGKDG